MYDELIKALHEGAEFLECSPPGINNAFARLCHHAAESIEELIRENESLAKSVNEASEILRKRWIPVTERLPEETGFTLIFTANGNPGVCYFTNGWWGGYSKDHITHWMPLPEPPEEDKT